MDRQKSTQMVADELTQEKILACVRSGNMQQFNALLPDLEGMAKRNPNLVPDIFNQACARGRLDILKTLHVFNDLNSIIITATGNAAEGGHLDVVNFLLLHKNKSTDLTSASIRTYLPMRQQKGLYHGVAVFLTHPKSAYLVPFFMQRVL